MSHYIQSIERAARVLTALSEGGNLMGVTEIAKRVNLGKSTVHRILVSLKRSRLVRMDPTSRQYSLGYGLLQLTAGLLRGSEVSITALPYLRNLHKKTGETVSLDVRDNDHRVVVERLDTAHEIRYVAEIGPPLPLHIGAGGKAILAFMDETEVRSLPGVAEMRTKQFQRLVKELEEIRAAGSAYTLGERLPGAGSISAPVFNHDGVVIASVNVLCLESRLNAKTVRDFRRLVQATAMDVSRELGWQAVGTPRQRVNESLPIDVG
jgi:DNA-binding IclR family transcriptional regulator